MPSFRRPWPTSRRDTDSVQMTALDESDVKKPTATTTSISGDAESEGSSSRAALPSGAKAEEDLKQFQTLHQWDPNLEPEMRDQIDAALKSHDTGLEAAIDKELEETSPYPEVAGTVRNTDDETMPANTVRAWFIGLLFTTIGSALNCLFSLRNPAITITSIVAQLVAYPVGVACAKYIPAKKFRWFGQEWTTNPGPFSMKEHCLITVMANVSFGTGAAYSTDTIEALLGFYKTNLGWGFNLLFTLSSQVLGFGIAGTFRRFLVWPASMIWPAVLPNVALFYALHDHTAPNPEHTSGWTYSKYKWYLIVFTFSFCWYWVPGVIWTGLSVFAFVTWIKPNNVVVNQLFGGFTGLSLLPITFDWTFITAYLNSPLIPPFHAIANTTIGVVIFFIIIACAMHYSNVFYGHFLPMSDSNSYDNHGMPYNVSRITTSDFRLNETAYAEYSPLFLSTTFSLAYGCSFATVIAVIFHTGLFHWKEIWYRYKAARNQEDDIHMKLMKKYVETPDWWYWAVYLVMFGVGMGTGIGYDTGLTWWAFIIAMLIALVWTVPIGMIFAITNIQIGLNVFTEFIIGYMLPGRPIAMMCFKTFGYITAYQALIYSQDLKMGHYMKVPPRALFWGQGVATAWSSLVQVAVLIWAFGAIDGICEENQSGRFSCPNGRVFFQASVIWGLIGPKRIFSPGSPGAVYANLQWFWLAGAALPIILYFLARRFPRSNIRYLNAPLIFGGSGFIPPATPLIYLSWAFVGFIFNKLIKNRKRGWWMYYNYITSAGMDSGLALCTIVIFFAILLPQATIPQWWGNTVPSSTLDAQGAAVQTVLSSGTFGPTAWA